MKHVYHLVIAGVLSWMCATAAAAQAQASTSKPVAMAGEWEHDAGATLYTGRWEILISAEKPDGTITGTLTYWAVRCNARGAAMSGRRSGNNLMLEATIGICGKGRFDLDEVAAGRYAGSFTIEGAEAGEKKATLAPR